jgi:hypothetical protein
MSPTKVNGLIILGMVASIGVIVVTKSFLLGFFFLLFMWFLYILFNHNIRNIRSRRIFIVADTLVIVSSYFIFGSFFGSGASGPVECRILLNDGASPEEVQECWERHRLFDYYQIFGFVLIACFGFWMRMRGEKGKSIVPFRKAS